MKLKLFNSDLRHQSHKYKFGYQSLFSYLMWGILIMPLLSPVAIAQETSSTSTAQFKVTFDPPGEDMPQSSLGGASRNGGRCLNVANDSAISFSALLPTSHSALTAASHPTILAYLPETTAQQVFYSWRDENNQDHYQIILPIEQKQGIVSLNLPKTAPPLEVGKNYQWAVGIMCDGRLQPDSPTIQGQIKRVELTSAIQHSLDSEISLKNAAVYGKNGLWYETVATLASLITAQPKDANLASNWQELLNSVGLEELVNVPINISQFNDK